MWAAGIDQSSLVPAVDQRLAFNNNFQQLRSMFWGQGVLGSQLGFLSRRWYLTQNGVTGIVAATARAEIAGTMQPTMSGRTKADFTVDFLLADPYFYSATHTQVPANGSGTQVINLGDGAAGFGQASGSGGVPFTIVLTGPLTAPITLNNQTAGVSVTMNPVTIPSGHFVTLDVMNYTAYTDAQLSIVGSVSHAGARPWMLLMPQSFTPAGTFVNLLTLTTGSSGDSGYATINFSYPYL
jgi:hypothetical protein